MARLLEILNENRIRGRMYRYLAAILSSAFLLGGLTLVLWTTSVEQYEKNTREVLSLNEFYVELEKVNEFLGEYVGNGEEESYQKLETGCRILLEKTKKLKKFPIGSSFVRDIQDVEKMAESYYELTEETHRLIQKEEGAFTSISLRDVLEKYYEACEIYRYIDDEFKGLHLALLEHTARIQKQISRKGTIYFTELIVILICAFTYGLYRGGKMAQEIAAPIQRLTETAEKISEGRVEEFCIVKTGPRDMEEAMILTDTFNYMMEQIKERIRLMRENGEAREALHEKELENLRILNLLRTSELKALQMQMNPHFLFNTLNMISKTAYLGELDKTVLLLQKTAQLLRYSLDYMGKSVTLKREMEMLGNYVYLQEQRFGERISFEFWLDERFHHIQIPCLILQPLVENSIVHGVGSYLKSGRIEISTRYLEKERKGVISIRDNGLGMDEEQIKSVRESLVIEKEQMEKIGLANVYRRLRLFFSGKSEMEIHSILGERTEIRLILPVEEGERDVQDSNSGR